MDYRTILLALGIALATAAPAAAQCPIRTTWPACSIVDLDPGTDLETDLEEEAEIGACVVGGTPSAGNVVIASDATTCAWDDPYASPEFTGIVTLPVADDPTTDAEGEIAVDRSAYGHAHAAIQFFDGVDSTHVVSAVGTPTLGQAPVFNGTTIGWYSPTAATTSTAGIVELATEAEVSTGADGDRAVTPLSLTGADLVLDDLRVGGAMNFLETGGTVSELEAGATPSISGSTVWETSSTTILTDLDDDSEGDFRLILIQHTMGFDCSRSGAAFFCDGGFLGTLWLRNGDAVGWYKDAGHWHLMFASQASRLDTASITIRDATVDDDVFFFKIPGTLQGEVQYFNCLASGTTTPVAFNVRLMECNVSGTNCGTTGGDHTMTATYTNYLDVAPTQITNAFITGSKYWMVDVTSLTTAPDLVTCDIAYYLF